MLLFFGFASANHGFYPPNDSNSFPYFKDIAPNAIRFFFEKNNENFFAVTFNPSELYFSNTTNAWNKLLTNLPIDDVYSMTADTQGNLYISGSKRNMSNNGFVYKSTNNGLNWVQVGTPILDAPHLRVKFLTGILYAWFPTKGIYYLDVVNQWRQVAFGDGLQPMDLIEDNATVYVLSTKDNISRLNNIVGAEIGRIPDSDYADWYGGGLQRYIARFHSNFFVITRKAVGAGGSVFKSSDGVTWQQVFSSSTKLPVSIAASESRGVYLIFNDGEVHKMWGSYFYNLSMPANPTSGYDVLPTSLAHTVLISEASRIWQLISNGWPHAAAVYWVGDQINAPVRIGDTVKIRLVALDWEPDLPLAINWQQLSGPSFEFDPSFQDLDVVIQQPGNYSFQAKVRDSFMTPNSQEGTISSVSFNAVPSNYPPTITTINNVNCVVFQECILSATAIDPENEIITYTWEQDQEIQSPQVQWVTIKNLATVKIIAPSAGTYQLYVTATDEQGASSFEIVTVNAATQQANLWPIANAGNDQTVRANQLVVLDGNQSSDPENKPLNYLWLQISGENVSITNASSVQASFTPISAGTYVFQLKVTDENGLNATDGVSIAVIEEEEELAAVCGNNVCEQLLGENADNCLADCNEMEIIDENESIPQATITQSQNKLPIIQVSPTLNASVGEQVMLSAIAVDPEGKSIQYEWIQISGSRVALFDYNTNSPSFTPSEPGTYTFQANAIDKDGMKSDPAIVLVNVVAENPLITETAGTQGTIAELLALPIAIIMVLGLLLGIWRIALARHK